MRILILFILLSTLGCSDSDDSNTSHDKVLDPEFSEENDAPPVVPPENEDDPVAPILTGEITLKWQAPVSFENDTPLHSNEIGGYKISWGIAPDDLSNVIDGISEEQTQYVVQDLAAGDYYFAVSVETIYGDESQISNIVQKTVVIN